MNKKVDNNINDIKVSEEVIAKITEIAISGIDGVCSLVKGKTSFSHLFVRAEQPSAIDVKVNGDSVEVSAEINVSSNCRVKNTAEKIQQRVKDDIQNMTGIAVTKVNVLVRGIVFDNE